MATRKKAAAKKTTASETAVEPQSITGNAQRPEADSEAAPTFRADMGEGLPPQKDQLNPDRAK